MKPETASTLDFQFAQWGEDGDYTPPGGVAAPFVRAFIVDAAAAQRDPGMDGHADEVIYEIRMRTDLLTPLREGIVLITQVGSEHLGKKFRLEALVEDDTIAPLWTAMVVP